MKLKVPDYTTIFKRVVKLDIPISETIMNSKEPVIIAVDASALENCEKIEKILADGAYDDKKNFNLDLGYKKWTLKHHYGYRWIAETAFSSVKRIMGEHVMATKTQNMFQEIVMKFTFYNMLLNVKM